MSALASSSSGDMMQPTKPYQKARAWTEHGIHVNFGPGTFRCSPPGPVHFTTGIHRHLKLQQHGAPSPIDHTKAKGYCMPWLGKIPGIRPTWRLSLSRWHESRNFFRCQDLQSIDVSNPFVTVLAIELPQHVLKPVNTRVSEEIFLWQALDFLIA
jgi:hypothetical protein